MNWARSLKSCMRKEPVERLEGLQLEKLWCGVGFEKRRGNIRSSSTMKRERERERDKEGWNGETSGFKSWVQFARSRQAKIVIDKLLKSLVGY